MIKLLVTYDNTYNMYTISDIYDDIISLERRKLNTNKYISKYWNHLK